MRNTLILTVLALGAAVLAVSCQKNVNEQEPVAAVGSRTFTCVIASPDTKVAVSDAGKTTWEVGDEILVHGEGSSNRMVVTLTADDISADGKKATITVEGITPYDRSDKGYTSTLYASYPAGVVSSGNLYYYSRFAETNHLLMAAYNEGDMLVFYNLCGVISFTVSGDFDSYTFAGNNGETVGYEKYQSRLAATDGDPVLQFDYPSDGGTSGPLTTISGEVAADGTTVNYVCIPNGADLTKGFTFKFKKDGTIVKTATTSTAVDVARNKILPLGDITSKLETYVPPAVSDHKSEIPTGSAVDLSADEAANCYIITAPGIYKFPAVKGNSEDPAGSVFGVKLLWETYNNSEEVTENSVVKAVDFEDNWIYIEMPSTLKAGNALIAAKDADDVIIWSWHIWVPATTITTIDNGIYSVPMMDRNLGALVVATADDDIAIESFGLSYQWGRKDPFVGAGVIGEDSNATVAGATITVTDGEGAADESKITLEQSIQNPTLYGHSKSADWLIPFDNTLWQNGVKTIYDPCPPGYRVPARDKAQPFHSGDLTAVTGWAETTNWFTLGDPVAVFPFAGYRDDYSPGVLCHAYDRGAYWTSYASAEDGSTAYYVNIRLESAHKLTEAGKSRGGSVRCVAD